MTDKRNIVILVLLWSGILPVWGGTGRPSDGFLSYILLFGFLLFILGIMQLAGYLRRKIRELLEDIF